MTSDQSLPTEGDEWFPEKGGLRSCSREGACVEEDWSLENGMLTSFPLLCRPEAPNEFYDGDHDNDKESDVEI